MGTWDTLKLVVAELTEDPRRPLRSYPGPQVDVGHEPPFRISLAPWATDIAQRLVEQFGSDVDVTVGALHFPDRMLRNPDGTSRRLREDPVPELPNDVIVELSTALVVRSGFDVRGVIDIHNRGDRELVIETTGALTARVVNAKTGAPVGGFGGFQTLALVAFSCDAGAHVAIPLLVGTASFVPELGYAVPPGTWAAQAVIQLRGRGRFQTPRLPLLVIY